MIRIRRWWVVGAAAVLCAAVVLVRQHSDPAPASPRLDADYLQARVERQAAEPVAPAAANQPLVVRTAQLSLIAADFAAARAAVDEILKRHGGHIGVLAITAPADSGRSLQATLRIPAPQLDAAMAEFRRLGRVESEQQGGEEVTAQVIDLEVRLANSRNTEQRLGQVLLRSTGKVSEILEVEKEIGRVRGEIERMEAERKSIADRISFATLEVRIAEEYRARLTTTAPSLWGRARNSAVEGYRNAAGSLVALILFVLSVGPVGVLWAAILFLPGRFAWRRVRGQAKAPALPLAEH